MTLGCSLTVFSQQTHLISCITSNEKRSSSLSPDDRNWNAHSMHVNVSSTNSIDRAKYPQKSTEDSLDLLSFSYLFLIDSHRLLVLRPSCYCFRFLSLLGLEGVVSVFDDLLSRSSHDTTQASLLDVTLSSKWRKSTDEAMLFSLFGRFQKCLLVE